MYEFDEELHSPNSRACDPLLRKLVILCSFVHVLIMFFLIFSVDSCGIPQTTGFAMYRSAVVSPYWIWTWFHFTASQDMEVTINSSLERWGGMGLSFFFHEPQNVLDIIREFLQYFKAKLLDNGNLYAYYFSSTVIRFHPCHR